MPKLSLKKRFEAKIIPRDTAPSTENRSSRREVRAILLLDKLFPGSESLFRYAEDGYLVFNLDEAILDKVLTDQDIQELKRCGVDYDLASSSVVPRLNIMVN